mmetsp:Transcript_7787/g.10684  ORF Transcript_7787/g.10684 Transcript_7787/m.10684 type:complete len:150 (+) Transcript_7787:455-904(+)
MFFTAADADAGAFIFFLSIMTGRDAAVNMLLLQLFFRPWQLELFLLFTTIFAAARNDHIGSEDCDNGMETNPLLLPLLLLLWILSPPPFVIVPTAEAPLLTTTTRRVGYRCICWCCDRRCFNSTLPVRLKFSLVPFPRLPVRPLSSPLS